MYEDLNSRAARYACCEQCHDEVTLLHKKVQIKKLEAHLELHCANCKPLLTPTKSAVHLTPDMEASDHQKIDSLPATV